MEASTQENQPQRTKAEKKAAKRAALIQDVAAAVWAMQPNIKISEASIASSVKAIMARADIDIAAEFARVRANGIQL